MESGRRPGEGGYIMPANRRLLLVFMLGGIILLMGSKTGWTEEKPFIVGEKLEYQVFMKGLPVGEQILSILKKDTYQGQAVFHIRLHLRSYPLYAFLFSYQEISDLYLDAEQLT